ENVPVLGEGWEGACGLPHTIRGNALQILWRGWPSVVCYWPDARRGHQERIVGRSRRRRSDREGVGRRTGRIGGPTRQRGDGRGRGAAREVRTNRSAGTASEVVQESRAIGTWPGG